MNVCNALAKIIINWESKNKKARNCVRLAEETNVSFQTLYKIKDQKINNPNRRTAEDIVSYCLDSESAFKFLIKFYPKYYADKKYKILEKNVGAKSQYTSGRLNEYYKKYPDYNIIQLALASSTSRREVSEIYGKCAVNVVDELIEQNILVERNGRLYTESETHVISNSEVMTKIFGNIFQNLERRRQENDPRIVLASGRSPKGHELAKKIMTEALLKIAEADKLPENQGEIPSVISCSITRFD